jgi:2-iminobutanoate/2-iminopropanoate deaminase
MPLQPVTTNKIPPSPNPFSLGIKAKGLLFVSGQVGKDSNGKVVEGFGAQVKQALENISTIVEAAGSSMDRVVKINIFVTDISRIPELNEIYRSFFPGVLPARAAVEVQRLGLRAEVEIEAIALCD